MQQTRSILSPWMDPLSNHLIWGVWPEGLGPCLVLSIRTVLFKSEPDALGVGAPSASLSEEDGSG